MLPEVLLPQGICLESIVEVPVAFPPQTHDSESAIQKDPISRRRPLRGIVLNHLFTALAFDPNRSEVERFVRQAVVQGLHRPGAELLACRLRSGEFHIRSEDGHLFAIPHQALDMQYTLFVGQVCHGSPETQVFVSPGPKHPGFLVVRPGDVALQFELHILTRDVPYGRGELRDRAEVICPDPGPLRDHEPSTERPAHEALQAESGVELLAFVHEHPCVGRDPGAARVIQGLPVVVDLDPLIGRQGVCEGHKRGEVEFPVDMVVAVHIRIDHLSAVGLLQVVHVPQGLLEGPEAERIPQRIRDDCQVMRLLGM